MASATVAWTASVGSPRWSMAALENLTAMVINYPSSGGNASLIKDNTGTRGALTRNIVDRSPHSSTVIPIFGDSNPGDQKEAFLEADIKGPDGTTVVLPAGSRLVES